MTIRKRLHQLIDSFPSTSVLLLGDLVLDRFILGTPKRISREAPLIILRYEGQRDVPGGGANALANLASSGGDGLTKLVYCPETHRLLGATLVGRNAGELLAECVLAMEMGATLEDVALSVHAHPTLSETVGFSAERALGKLTDL